MTEKQKYDPMEHGLSDTQRLLQGVETPPEGTFDLEDILAEFGTGAEGRDASGSNGHSASGTGDRGACGPVSQSAPESALESVSESDSAPGSDSAPEEPTKEFLVRQIQAASQMPERKRSSVPPERQRSRPERMQAEKPEPVSGSKASPEPKSKPVSGPKTRPELKPKPVSGSKTGPEPKPKPVSGPKADPELEQSDPISEPKPPKPNPQAKQKSAPGSQPVLETLVKEKEPDSGELSVEEIVASTVDAVKEQQARQQERFLKHLKKIRKKTDRGAGKRHTPVRRPPPDAPESETPPGEAAGWHRRWYKTCRASLVASLPVLGLLWLPWILAQVGVEIPFFSASTDNAALCVLVPQAVLCILCWPVFRAALDWMREGVWTACAAALLTTVATLLDEMTLLLLPGRSDVAPMGGVAAALVVFCLWGMTGYHRGMAETLRTAAMGVPSRLVDSSEAGIAKGAGGLKGFLTRLNMEDAGSQWQRLLLPLLAGASAVFALLASVGQGRGQDLLWCWSVILCASTSLVFPLVFFVPFGRLAARLARLGAAVAGQYGASILSSDPRLVVTDGDLFPQGSAALNGMKPYGEEREKAISYAATLAVQGGGLLGRLFEDLCRSEEIAYQPLEHFHVHEDSGLGGMIHGETVLVGTAAFMRHMAVRLPAALPGKMPVCLAVDGQLTAVFAVKYSAAESVSAAINALRRNGLQISLAVRDGNVTPKLLRARFGTDGGAIVPELSERLNLSDPEREVEGPNGLLYRDGLLPFVSLVAGSRRLCQTVRVGNLLSILGSVSGVLLGFYLTFVGSYGVLTPVLLLTYLLLWVVPMVPLVWGVDRL